MVNVATVSGDQLKSGFKKAVPGWFHANITQLKETDKCDGLELHGTVLAGKPNDPTVTDFVDSGFRITLWYPDSGKSQESQDKNNARLTALLIATDLITPAQLGQPISADEQLAVGRHVLIHICYSRKNTGQKDPKTGKDIWADNPDFLDLAFNDILHIDDPAGANVPKNIAALKYVPANLRHTDDSYFAFKAKPGAATATVGTAPAHSTAPAGTVF